MTELNEKPKNVCIIGAGLSGMVTAKSCLEYGLQPIVYERTKNLGGLWRYREQIEPGQGSVMRSTVVNSSKTLTAFSDYPFPDKYPNFMPNDLMYEYLVNYAKEFQLDSYIRYSHEVIRIEHCNDPLLDGGGYLITVKNLTDNEDSIQTIRYDAVAIWKILHSHNVRSILDNPDFIDKRIVVLGIGNSGGDVAAEAAPVAKQVYLSSRNGGTWLLRRTGLNGQPVDTVGIRRAFMGALHLLPYSLRCSVMEFLASRMVGHDLLGLRPEKTRFLEQHAMVNDHIPTYIHLGWIKMRFGIESFVPNGVIFERDQGRITECDLVIMATGYEHSFPFITSDVFDLSNGRFDLYKHVFDPRQPQPECLAFIGLPAANGSLPPISEIQSRWFCMLLTGQCKSLPNKKKMFAKIEKDRKWVANRYGSDKVERFRFEVEMLDYMDTVARSAGLRPNIAINFLKDPKLWWALLFKPCIAAQYRLRGPGSKPKQARQLILTIDERIKAPYRKTSEQQSETKLKQQRQQENGNGDFSEKPLLLKDKFL
ncbi:hypothetical protein DERP_003502 [Dermatophagoides pteronyssinus]|uniref:Flavin-containing monooxygenase n=1 Tax=Dermatophagoides pteronyssinus TaxID=6956 RepID=A0ABQ8JKZ1_DERPT|nr:hypothetical protein DERP_003502 [Dermatophagoides pteronyssinus]